MSNQRYTPEFKDEAVRQVVERGYRVAEVADLRQAPHIVLQHPAPDQSSGNSGKVMLSRYSPAASTACSVNSGRSPFAGISR